MTRRQTLQKAIDLLSVVEALIRPDARTEHEEELAYQLAVLAKNELFQKLVRISD